MENLQVIEVSGQRDCGIPLQVVDGGVRVPTLSETLLKLLNVTLADGLHCSIP